MPGIFNIIKKLLVFLSVFACGTLIGMLFFQPLGAIALGVGLAVLATAVFYGYGFIKNIINGESESEHQKGRGKSGGLLNKLEKFAFGQDPKTKTLDNLRNNIADTKKSTVRILKDQAKRIYEEHEKDFKQNKAEFSAIFWSACQDKESWKGKICRLLPNRLKLGFCFDKKYKDFLAKWKDLRKIFLRELKLYLDAKQKTIIMEVDSELEKLYHSKEAELQSKRARSSSGSSSGQEESVADVYADSLRDTALSIIGGPECSKLFDDKKSKADFRNRIREACRGIIAELKESYGAIEPEKVRLEFKPVLESSSVMNYFKNLRRSDNTQVNVPGRSCVTAEAMPNCSDRAVVRS